ncbi:hypothetical protein Vretimale_16082 [Volvox reticuliferus]|uniref:Uncharacterized protein n=1 Tax=Volvox reticuliferus TaxID=1737510 RepID=A0A8J4CDQ3_9CHLO|nr:hypothetical protein Vretifemale_9675 [Volvox reticuliferus]GIM12847.1 hypothetical protein Vretimale_16082 [Volvox reticuliferus]
MKLNSATEHQSLELSSLVRACDDAPSGSRTYARGLSSRRLTPLRRPSTSGTLDDSTSKFPNPPLCPTVTEQLPGFVHSPKMACAGKAAVNGQDSCNQDKSLVLKSALGSAAPGALGEPAALEKQSSDVMGRCGTQHSLQVCTTEQRPGAPFTFPVMESEAALKTEAGPRKLPACFGTALATAAAPTASSANNCKLWDRAALKPLAVAVVTENMVKTDSPGAGASTSSAEPDAGRLLGCGAGNPATHSVYASRFISAQQHNSSDGNSIGNSSSSSNATFDITTASRRSVSGRSIPLEGDGPCSNKERILHPELRVLGPLRWRRGEAEEEGDIISMYCAEINRSLMEEQARCRRLAQKAGRRLERKLNEARQRAAEQMRQKKDGKQGRRETDGLGVDEQFLRLSPQPRWEEVADEDAGTRATIPAGQAPPASNNGWLLTQ